ncbi:MAG: penicillin-binding protein 2 [Bordetella sp.]|nr:MAG: penicillin-binding protein 2 [Bordetella sp.]
MFSYLYLENNFQIKKSFHLRIFISIFIIILCFVILITRFWYLQVVLHDDLTEKANFNRVNIRKIQPPRGQILDRNGKILACNYPAYGLDIIPRLIDKSDNFMERLNPMIHISISDQKRLKRQIGESNRYMKLSLRNNLSETEASWFAAHSFEFPGIELRAYWSRDYPQKSIGAHVVGYVGRITDSELKKIELEGMLNNYRVTDFIGKRGIEKICETTLHGKIGIEEIEVNSSGKPIRTLRYVNPEPGKDIILSIDIELQRIADQAFGNQRGALVAICPNTGEILAFVSKPSFDPNLFVNGISLEDWKKINSSPDYPLVNRALYGTYPIGSTYKPFVALAALELGKRNAIDQIPDPGYFEFGGRKFRNSGGTAYGMTDMHRAIVLSSDTYFYSLGPEIGVDALHDFLKQFGFGQIIGIDLDGERSGILPSTEWKKKAYKDKNDQRWYIGETISLTVGQGYNSFTLLQLAQGTAILANGGLYKKPHLISAIKKCGSNEIEEVIPITNYQIPLKPGNVDAIKMAMRDVIRYGTARRAFSGAAYLAAGKTGTAQLYSLRDGYYRAIDERLRDHSLFIGFAPIYNPKIAIAVIAENAGWGANVAAPIARKVFDHWLITTKNYGNF